MSAEERDRDLRRRLGALRAELPEAEFHAALRRKLVAAGPPADPSLWARLAEALRPRRLLWPAAGAAAGVAAFLLLAAPALRRPDAGASFGTLLPATQVAVVRLNLSADAPVEGAQIRVSLPPGLSFWADGRELAARDFEWTQPLDAGDNEIPIAVKGTQPGRYRIAVNARVGDQWVEDEILIEVTRG